jgi:hypothetical protein
MFPSDPPNKRNRTNSAKKKPTRAVNKFNLNLG